MYSYVNTNPGSRKCTVVELQYNEKRESQGKAPSHYPKDGSDESKKV